MAIIGMFFQDGLTGSAWGDWASYTDSPLRAVEAPDLSSELGACPPLGFWDPLDLSKFDDPVVATTQFKRRRVIELQHGRVSMLACIGYIVPEYFKWPGYCSPSIELKFEDIPNGLQAVDKIPGIGWVQILAFVGLIEVFNLQSEPKEYAGDYEGFGVFGIPGGGSFEDKERKEKSLLAEINNGRLAMMSIIGMFFQNGLTGSAWGDWANYTDSPMRAFESELGVQEPVGFWDPLGLSADGDSATFLRRRESEIKHGRISMLATMGYITPELTGKFPGMLSQSEGVSFADIPNGLGAISKVPALGWGQIVLYCAAVEGAGANNRGDGPGEFGWKVLTSSDPEAKRSKLAAEIANGRLAMMAIIGMFFQDGLTGSAWGDWAAYTDSPLRAFENELGVQAPVGYWDPLGLGKDGDADVFRRRREVEIKHGRVCMIATIGFMVTSVGYRFPGELSPSTGITFEKVPAGLDAIGAVPALGWVQIFIFGGLIDFGLFRQDPARDPGDFENGGILGVPNASGPMSDAEGRKRKLNAELANGRLAMVAIMGMLFQNGTVGSSGPEMWGF